MPEAAGEGGQSSRFFRFWGLHLCSCFTGGVIEGDEPPITQTSVHVDMWGVHILLTPRTYRSLSPTLPFPSTSLWSACEEPGAHGMQ